MKRLQCCFVILISICFIACENSNKKNASEKNSIAHIDTIGVKLDLINSTMIIPVELNAPKDSSHRMFITDNGGRIWILKKDSLFPKPFFTTNSKIGKPGVPLPSGNIFSATFHPQFSTNGKFYVFYTVPTNVLANTCKAVVSQFTVSNNDHDVADIKSEKRILEIEGKNIGFNGAQISFGPDGYLYISIGDDKLGDSAYQYHAQDLKLLNGKLLRIDVNKTPYGIPSDNPFISVKDARPEIFAYGLRKLWRYCFDSASHQLFGADIGEKKSEEIDIITKAGNYGWPIEEGDSNFEKKDTVIDLKKFTTPINTYDHKTGICIVGGMFYHGNQMPALKDKYVFGDFNGSLFALMKNEQSKWIREPLKIMNKPASQLFICGLNAGENNELFVMGILNSDKGPQGVVYRIVPM